MVTGLPSFHSEHGPGDGAVVGHGPDGLAWSQIGGDGSDAECEIWLTGGVRRRLQSDGACGKQEISACRSGIHESLWRWRKRRRYEHRYKFSEERNVSVRI